MWDSVCIVIYMKLFSPRPVVFPSVCAVGTAGHIPPQTPCFFTTLLWLALYRPLENWRLLPPPVHHSPLVWFPATRRCLLHSHNCVEHVSTLRISWSVTRCVAAGSHWWPFFIVRRSFSVRAVYDELHNTLMAIDEQEDLRWWKNTHGPGMPTDWPHFQVFELPNFFLFYSNWS